MAGVALLDINVLIALFHPDHVHHELAHDWFADHRDAGWATCPITENGFLRVAAQLAGREATLRPATIVDRLRRFCDDARHHFWPDELSLREATVFDAAFVRGHRQVTDVYLLAVACGRDGCLATFDGGIPIRAVRRATRDHLAVIAA